MTARRPAIGYVMATVFLDMLAIAIVLPVLPRLVLRFEDGDTAAAAEVLGVFGTAFNVMQFLLSPVLGALSDRVGRRPVLLASNLGRALDYALMALAPGVPLVFAGRLISGSSAASNATGGGYVADILPPERRAAGFGLINVAFGAGFVLGPAIGGLLGGFDDRLPFWVAAAIGLLNGGYCLWLLPESLPRPRRAAFAWRRANPLATLALLARHRQLRGIAAAQFLLFVAQQSLIAVFVLYATYRYHWGANTVGLAFGGFGLCAVAVGGLVVRPVVLRLGERRAMLLGFACAAAGFTAIGAADTPLLAWIGLPVLSLMGLVSPAAQAAMTRLVPHDEQGRLQGAVASILSIAGLIGPALFTAVYAIGVREDAGWHLPGAPWFLAALILAAGFVVTLLATGREKARQTGSAGRF